MTYTTFNLQMFGDNDTVTSSTDLQIEWGFYDGDTRKTTLPNPRSNLDSDAIVAVSTMAETQNIIIGDKAGASSTGINSAIIVEQTKTKLDLTN